MAYYFFLVKNTKFVIISIMRKEISWTSKSKGLPRTGYYEDADDFSTLPTEKIKAICAFCFCKGKWVIVYNGSNLIRNWEPVAGHIEEGETPEQALIREVKEESNMKVLKHFPLGYLHINEVGLIQAQYLCLVEPYGPFVSDPDEGVSEIKLVNFEEMDKYFIPEDTSRLTLDRCKEVFEKIDKNL